MNPQNLQQQLESEKRAQISHIETVRSEQKQGIKQAEKQEISARKLEVAGKREEMKNQLSVVESNISNLEKYLANPNLRESDRKEIDKKLKNLKRQRNYIKQALARIDWQLNSHVVMIRWMYGRKLEMIENKLNDQKSLMLRSFGERLMQLTSAIQQQEMMKQAQKQGANLVKMRQTGEAGANAA
ncbi:MAG: hypothetical protein ACOCXP_01575 [Candidatus Dojkabacteria bacterium]